MTSRFSEKPIAKDYPSGREISIGLSYVTGSTKMLSYTVVPFYQQGTGSRIPMDTKIHTYSNFKVGPAEPMYMKS